MLLKRDKLSQGCKREVHLDPPPDCHLGKHCSSLHPLLLRGKATATKSRIPLRAWATLNCHNSRCRSGCCWAALGKVMKVLRWRQSDLARVVLFPDTVYRRLLLYRHISFPKNRRISSNPLLLSARLYKSLLGGVTVNP